MRFHEQKVEKKRKTNHERSRYGNTWHANEKSCLPATPNFYFETRILHCIRFFSSLGVIYGFSHLILPFSNLFTFFNQLLQYSIGEKKRKVIKLIEYRSTRKRINDTSNEKVIKKNIGPEEKRRR